MTDPTLWTGHRVESWVYDVLDRAGRVIGRLEDVDDDSPGSITRSIHTSPRDTATVQLVKRADWDWTLCRLRITHVLHAPTGEIRTPVLTGVVSAPVESHTDQTVTVALDLADKTSLLAGDQWPGTYSVAAGMPILDTIREIIASTGDTSILVGGTGDVLDSPMTWDAGTSKLQEANDLLDAGGFLALHCDGMGAFRATPYVAPDQRGIAWRFTGGFLPSWSRDADVYSVPNRQICVGRSDSTDAAAPVGIAEDRTSRFGFDRTGRWITVTETGVEATSQAQLDAIAQRKLTSAQQVTETLTITHPWLPSVDLNAVVEVLHPRLGQAVRCVVQKQTISLALGGLVTATLRRIA